MRSLTAVGCGRGRGAGTRGIATGAHFGWLPTLASLEEGHCFNNLTDIRSVRTTHNAVTTFDAEDALKAAHAEILAQRTRMGELSRAAR